MPVVGSFGDYVFRSGVSEYDTTFNALSVSRQSRVASHATLSELPVVEALGLDSMRVTLSGVINRQFTRDPDAAMARLMALQDGRPRALTRGTHCYGLFIATSVRFSEDAWSGSIPAAISWTIELVQARG